MVVQQKGYGMRNLWLWSVLSLVVAPVWAASSGPATEEQKTFYALGLMMSQSLSQFTLSEAELDMVKAGLTDGVLKRSSKVELKQIVPKVQQLAQSRADAAAAVEKKAGAAYLAKAAGEKGATKTESGLVITTIKAGTGNSPKKTDKVKVHYHGTLIDGTVFDSSVQRGEPATFGLDGVIPCWTEGVQRMKVGGKSRLVCPPQLAYGDRGAPTAIKPGATLVFDVELLAIEK
jgi:FKBP-type peptidyl-prolyl cis-trans isomerase FkpA/FKBP-type peptidyl-prolyl cis-trans isomerase FklB